MPARGKVTVSTLVDLPAVLAGSDDACGLSRFINAVSRCTLSRIAPRVVPSLYRTPRCGRLHWAIRPVLFPRPRRAVDGASNRREYRLLSRLAEAEQLAYGDIIRDWMASPPATKVKNE